MENIKITALDHYGRGIGRINDKIIFIDNALVNDAVKVDIVTEKKNYYEGKIIEYVSKSEDHIKADCPYYDLCGGCNIMHMSYSNQLVFKANKVKEILSKFADVEVDINEIIGSEEYNYRNKVTLQVKGKYGFYKKDSYEIINIDNCLISDNKINKVMSKFKSISLNKINQIIIKASSLNEVMVVIYVEGNVKESSIINELKSVANSIIIKDKYDFKTIYGSDTIREKIGEYLFNISADSFFQINTKQAYKMYEIVKKYIGKCNNLLDLYCGTGTIGIYLSSIAKKVIGVEINKSAIEDANNNALLNNVTNIEFICDDVSKVINDFDKIDAIVVDPPRSGLDSITINSILDIKPDKIVYVSCDPVTLARDIKLLKDSYEVKEVTPLDMFPNTYHVECIVLLQCRTRQ